MKTLTFNKNSIHFRLANMYDDFDCNDDHDICSYSRFVIAGFVVSVMALGGITFMWYLLVNAVLGIIFSLLYGVFLFNEAGFAGAAVITFILLLSLVTFGNYSYRKYKNNKTKHNKELGLLPTPDSFLVNAFKSWKEKYCVRVTFGE